LPKDVIIDGMSFADRVTGRDDGRPRREWIFSQLNEKRVIRDKRFKLWSDGRFYDLANDPGEERDLSANTALDVVEAQARLSAVLGSLPADAKSFLPPGPPASAPASGQRR
jgi:arylsulfatase A-like enzyme